MEEKAIRLYNLILQATKDGKDAEVRVDKKGDFVVFSVKRSRAEKRMVTK